MRIVDLALKDLRQVLRDWKSAIFLVIMPTLFTLFFGFVLGPQFSQDASDQGVLPIGLANQAGDSLLASNLKDLLAGSQSLEIVELPEAQASSLEARVAEGEYAGALIIPAGYSQVQVGDDLPRLSLIVDTSGSAGQTVIQAIEMVLGRLEGARQVAEISADLYRDGRAFEGGEEEAAYMREGLSMGVASWAEPPVQVRVERATKLDGGQSEPISGFTQASPGMIVQFAIFGLITSAMVLVMERKSGALARLMTAPVRKFEIIGGHILAMFLLILAQEILLVALGQLLFGVDYGRDMAAIGLMIVSLALWGASLGLFIGAISKSEEGVVMLSLAAMFLFSGLGGAWFPLEVAGDTFAAIGHLTPTAWAMDGFQNIVVRGLGLDSVLIPAALLSAYTVAFFGLAVWRFGSE